MALTFSVCGKLITPFVNECTRYGAELKEAFIVQEWCAGNLRHVVTPLTDDDDCFATVNLQDVEFLQK